MAQLLSGKEVAGALAGPLRERAEAAARRGSAPTLAIVRVGERPDDLSYERTALKRAEALGVQARSIALPADASAEQVLAAIEGVNADASIHGCLLFRPLPAHLAADERRICDALAVGKDVDGISARSLASVYADLGEGFAPCTPAACMRILSHYGVSLEGRSVAVVGRSLVVGKPLAMMLLRENATVTLCHSRTVDLEETCRRADIVICAVGRARRFGAGFFRSGQTVLDVGINFDEEGALCGDVDFAAVEPIVEAITPVPGGVGSVTTSLIMEHAIEACERALDSRP